MLHQIFERDLNPERLLQELSAHTGETILKSDTLLFFDEIQTCERALTSLKYFCEQTPDYHIIAAGSLLGVTLNRQEFSFPVGKVDRLQVFPLDFEEFLWALGRKSGCEPIRKCFENNEKFTSHDTFLDFYRIYLLVGGMPQVINEYVESQDFNRILALQKNINDAYIADMAKYAESSR